MPSAAHEVLVAALGDTPELLASLLETLVGRRPGVPLTRVDSTLRFADRVTRWARTVGRMRGPLGTVMQLVPVVVPLGGASLEKLLDPARPELALLAAWTVRRRRGPVAREIVCRALLISEKLPPALRDTRRRGILELLDRALKQVVEDQMGRLDEIQFSEETRRLADWLEVSRPRRLARAIAPLLAVLEARGIELAPKHREILDQFPTDEEVIEYLRRAAVANSADEVFR